MTNRFYGSVGYIETQETAPGVWKNVENIRKYKGYLTRLSSKWKTKDSSTNDDVRYNTEISIIADPYAYEHFVYIRWVEFMGAKWEVTAVQPQGPEMILSIGELYNGSGEED